MENRERYKRLIMFLASAFILTLQTGVFAYVWFKDYAFSERSEKLSGNAETM